jgi:hypothetical protein
MKARERAIVNREKKRKKQERTRHLIKCGEIAEKYFNLQNIHPVEFEKILGVIKSR